MKYYTNKYNIWIVYCYIRIFLFMLQMNYLAECTYCLEFLMVSFPVYKTGSQRSQSQDYFWRDSSFGWSQWQWEEHSSPLLQRLYDPKEGCVSTNARKTRGKRLGDGSVFQGLLCGHRCCIPRTHLKPGLAWLAHPQFQCQKSKDRGIWESCWPDVCCRRVLVCSRCSALK